MNENPLKKHYRVPGTYITLPSDSRYYDDDDIDLTTTGELPVLPMTSSDEILLKNPEALINGEAVEKMISSCCPGIKNVKKLVGPDIDTICLAIRSVTYGSEMTIEATCPKCETENDYSIDLLSVLGDITSLDKEYVVTINDAKVYMMPHSYESSLKGILMSVEEDKLYRDLMRDNPDDDKRIKIASDRIQKMAQMNKDLLVNSVEKVVVPSDDVNSSEFISVTDPKHIKEYLDNISKTDVDRLEECTRKINSTGVRKEYDAKCSNEECGHEWTTNIEFEPAHFFD